MNASLAVQPDRPSSGSSRLGGTTPLMALFGVVGAILLVAAVRIICCARRSHHADKYTVHRH